MIQRSLERCQKTLGSRKAFDPISSTGFFANFFQVRIRKFEDETYEQIQTLLEQMDASSGAGHRSRGAQPARVG